MQPLDMEQPAAATVSRKARLKRYAFFAIPVIILALSAIAALAKRSYEPADVQTNNNLRTATAVMGDIESTVLASGILQASDQISVGAQVSGQVTSLKVKLGQHVKKGDLIAEIDATAQKNELRNAEASLKSLDAQMRAKQTALEQAKSTMKRQKQMLDQDASSRADYEAAVAAWDMARTDVTALEAQIEQAQIQADRVKLDLSHTSIRAPIDGTVVSIVTKEGQTLNSAQQVPTIVRLAHLDSLVVKAQISEVDVARVKAGMPVYFTLMGEPGRRYESRLQVVEPVPESANQEGGMTGGAGGSAVYYNALFSVNNSDSKLRIGMTVQAFIVLTRAKNVLTVPLAALRESESRTDDSQAAQTLGNVQLQAPEANAEVRDTMHAEAAGGLKLSSTLNLLTAPTAAPAAPRTADRYVVQVLSNGQWQTREVKVGVRDNMNAEIIEGLKAGEQVLLPDAAPATSADPAAPAAPAA